MRTTLYIWNGFAILDQHGYGLFALGWLPVLVLLLLLMLN